MTINNKELLAITAIKNLKYVGEIREDSYKKAVLHSYNAAVHLYNDGYYTAAVQNAHWCADMAVKLFLWKKHLVNYTDYHNLPMSRILNWMPQEEKNQQLQKTIAALKELAALYEQFGNYGEMVEEHPEHLFSIEKQDLFQEKAKNLPEIKEAAKKAVLLIDSALPVLLNFEK